MVSTTDIPSKFLKAACMVGHVPLKAVQSDPRVSYSLYIPPARYDTGSNPVRLPLLVWVHGTGRKLAALYGEELVSYADTTPCAILTPLFPAGLDGPNDLDSYKTLYCKSLRSDLVLLSILDEVTVRWPAIRTDKVFMMGFSGGGQFAHRFLYLYPERLSAISIGAPGRVTVLDESLKWPDGVADVQKLFSRPVNKHNIRKVIIQLVVGSADNQIHGGAEFSLWLQQHKNEAFNTIRPMKRGRVELLTELQSTWKRDGIESQLDIVDGISHESERASKHMLQFLRLLIEASFQENEAVGGRDNCE